MSPIALSVFPAWVLSVSARTPIWGRGLAVLPVQEVPHECLFCTETPLLIF